MSADDHLGVAVQQGSQVRQRGPDPAVVGDAAAVERHIEIVAHQHALACNHEVVDCLHREISFDPTQQEPVPGGIPDSGSQRDPRACPAVRAVGRHSGGTFVGSAVEPRQAIVPICLDR
jgi:hypothetical protein